MAKIIWKGNKKEFGTVHKSPQVPQNAVKIRDAYGFIGESFTWYNTDGNLYVGSFFKAFINKESPISPIFFIPAFLVAFIIALPLHEFVHAICYPKEATVWVGLCIRKRAAYAISYYPISKSRFIIMSIAPAVLGVIPLIGVILIPISMKPLLTICIVSAFMGLIAPAPDYMDIVSVLKKAPSHALICDTQEGLYAYEK